MAKKQKSYKGTENKPMFEAHVNRSFSGAAGTHQDKRLARVRTRQTATKNAINEYRS